MLRLSFTLIAMTLALGAAEPLRLGVIVAQSGDAAAVNALAVEVARAALAQQDPATAGGRQVTLVAYDNRSSVLGAKQAAQRAVADGVVAVVGCLRSSYSLAAARVLQEADIPMVSPMATNPAVTAVGDRIFRVCFTDAFQGRVLAAFAHDDLGARRAAMLVDVGRIYSTDLAEVFAAGFTASGGEVAYRGDYLGGTADFGPHVRSLVAAGVDVVFVPGEIRESGFLMRQARAAGVEAIFLGPDAWQPALYDVAGPAAEGACYSDHWHRLSELPESRAFVAAWEAEGGRTAGSLAALTHDAVMVVLAAIARAEALDGASLAAALRATDHAGVTGRIRFDAQGDPLGKPAVIVTLRGGEAVYRGMVVPEAAP